MTGKNRLGRHRLRARVSRAVDVATGALNLVGSALVLGLMVLVGADVAGRNLLDAPLPGVPEMVSLSILVIVFLQAPRALERGRLTRSDTLLDALGRRAPRAARGLESLHDLAGAAVFGIVVVGTWPLLVKAVDREQLVGAIGDFTAPVWPVRLAVLVGSVALVVHFALRVARRVAPREGDGAGGEEGGRDEGEAPR